MSILVKYEVHDSVAVITVDNPPVNALSPGVPEGLQTSIERALIDSEVKSIVVIGAGRTFIAGADISVLRDLAWGKAADEVDFHELLGNIENASKPVVMSIHGTALGGGLEVAMAGHYRVAVASAQLGQPEVNLGIIPGAEGTQRLPRLVGVQRALTLCVGGQPITAPEALSIGLIDAIIEGDLLEGAIAFAKSVSKISRTRERNQLLGNLEENAPLFASARVLSDKTRRNQEAPLKAIEAIDAATRLPFEAGCKRERELFLECVASDQAKSLIHAFFAERAASKVPGVDKNTQSFSIARVAVVGAGTMGGGITMACINAGIPVILREENEQALESGLARIRSNYDGSVKRGRLTTQDVEQRMASIQPQLNLQGFDTVDLIIEAVFENMALKKSVMKELDDIAKPGCVLATNTSTLDIDEIASVTSRPDFVVGMHFFSPANVMRLLEIVRGKDTEPAVIGTAMTVAKTLKKVGVVVGNCPGFVGNRMFFPYMYEGQFLVDDGATPEQVDRVLTEFGMAMGIFAVDDLAGIDVAQRVKQELRHFSQAGVRKPLVQDQLYARGRYGQKTGKGWYLYGADRKPVSDPEVTSIIENSRNSAGIRPRKISGQEILERTIYALINEGARILEEGFALRSSDIDVIYLNGYGFPNWRGGPMCYADVTGLDKVLQKIEGFHQEFGERWKPAPLLQRLATAGRRFSD